jgi:predicted DNA binding CopG/RHH family protein
MFIPRKYSFWNDSVYKSGFLEQAIGERVKRNMSKKIKWVDEFEGMTSADDLVVIESFFTLDELAELQRKRKITIELRDSDIQFFKAEAKKRKVSYQAMIRDLLSSYAQQLRQPNAG